jgi:hypothetical protein
MVRTTNRPTIHMQETMELIADTKDRLIQLSNMVNSHKEAIHGINLSRCLLMAMLLNSHHLRFTQTNRLNLFKILAS